MNVAIKGSVFVRADRDLVWAALFDVDRIALCVPNCESLTRIGGDGYALTAAVGLGPVKIGFSGTVRVLGSEAPSRLVLEGRGAGGIAGSAFGATTIDLVALPGGCRLAYDVQAEISGPMANLGSAFLTGVATTLSGLFARRFAAALASGAAPRGPCPDALPADGLDQPEVAGLFADPTDASPTRRR